MTRARTGGTLPFRLIAAFVVMMFVVGVAATGYSVTPGGHAETAQAAVGSAEIRGVKYHDIDFNGTMDPGEEGLPGWTMVLTADSRPGWVATVTTGANGEFAFTGLSAATYAITEIEQPGWHNTNGLPHFVTVQEGEIASTENEIGSVEDHASITLTRGVAPMTYRSAGDVLTFTYTVRNTGNVTLLAPFSISDDKVNVEFPSVERLVPGAEVSFTASYIVTPADVVAGLITSTAVVHVDGFPDSNTVTITARLDKRVDTALLIHASHYGRKRHQKVVISTDFQGRDMRAGFAGCEVLFEVKEPGATSWKTVSTQIVDRRTGKACYLAKLDAGGTYWWRTRFLGNDRLEPATSRTIRVKVNR